MKNRVGILELFTEEESVLTLFHMLKKCGFSVSLFLSDRVWKLISDYVQLDDNDQLLLISDSECFSDAKDAVLKEIQQREPGIIILPRFCATSKKDFDAYCSFAGSVKLCIGVFNYRRWFSKIPPIASFSVIRDWYYCRKFIKKPHSFFVSEILRDSHNPMKELLITQTGKIVLDLPFKISEKRYSPNFDYDFPRFVIPGKIQEKRRDYIKVLDFFATDAVISQKWELLLLGKPDGKYGKKVIDYLEQINMRAGSEKIRFYQEYVDKNVFDREMNWATHIMAPISPKCYEKGKDSGAIYDVFLYNKIGIFDERYFYENESLISNGVLKFNDSSLASLLIDIIEKNNENDELRNMVGEIAEYVSEEKYKEYLENGMKSLLD